MLGMVRAQLFRVARSPFLVPYAVVFCLIAVATPFALWLYEVWPDFALSGVMDVPDEPLPSGQVYGVSFVSGSFVAIGAGVAMGYFTATDFKSGFVKNLVKARSGRLSYAVAMLVCTLVLVVVTVVIGVLVVEAALRLQGYVAVLADAVASFASLAAAGFTVSASSLAGTASWLAEAWLSVSAYSMIAVAVAFLTGSEAFSVVAGLLLGGAAVENLLYAVVRLLSGSSGGAKALFDGYLAATVSRLGYGDTLPPEAMVPVLATVAVAVFIGVLVLRRRSLA